MRTRSRARLPLLQTAAADVLRRILLAVAVAAVTAGADSSAGAPVILSTTCAATTALDPEGFDVSFVTTLELIYQNVTRSGFGAASSGAGNDSVFGLGQCLAYLSPTDCQLCYAQSRVKLPHCLPADGGRIYLDGCFLRYGAGNFTAAASDAADTAVCSNATAPSAPAFAAAAADLVRNVTASAPGAKGYYYAASAMPSGPRVYAAAQCWRSLNASACKACVASACKACVASARDRVVGRCLPGAAEGYGLNAGCLVRYSTEPFYLAANAGGGGRSSTRKIIIIVIACVFSALAVIGIAFFWTRMRHMRDDLHDEPCKRRNSGLVTESRAQKRQNTNVDPESVNVVQMGEDRSRLLIYQNKALKDECVQLEAAGQHLLSKADQLRNELREWQRIHRSLTDELQFHDGLSALQRSMNPFANSSYMGAGWI